MTRRGENAGCQVLSTVLEELRHCKMHVFGHIHEAHGALLRNTPVRVLFRRAAPAPYHPLLSFQPLHPLTMTEELNRELINSRMKIIYDSWVVCPTPSSFL